MPRRWRRRWLCCKLRLPPFKMPMPSCATGFVKATRVWLVHQRRRLVVLRRPTQRMVSTPPSPGVVAVLPSPHLAPVCVVPVCTQRRLRVYSASQHHRPTPRRKLLSKPTLRMQNARYAGELLVWLATHTHTHTQRHTHTRSMVLTVHMVTPQALLQHAASLYKRERDLAAREERLQQQADALATKLPSLANSYDGAETPAMTLEVEQGPGTSDDSLDGVDEEVRASPGAHGLACQC